MPKFNVYLFLFRVFKTALFVYDYSSMKLSSTYKHHIICFKIVNIHFFFKVKLRAFAFDTVYGSNTRECSAMNHAVYSFLNTVLIIGPFYKTLTTPFSVREDLAFVKSCFQCVKDTCRLWMLIYFWYVSSGWTKYNHFDIKNVAK